MPRYYFNLLDGVQMLLDDDGAEFATLDQAYLEAFASAQEIWGRRILDKRNPLSCSFHISDPWGTVLLVLPFKEVLENCIGAARSVRQDTASRGNPRAAIEQSKHLHRDLALQLELLANNLAATRLLLAKAKMRRLTSS